MDFKDYPGDWNEQSNHVLGLLLNEGVRPKGIPQPTAVWFTGGGYQAVWRLEEPLGIEEGEALNQTLLYILQGGPGTHNADRLLRLPWTMNWLNDKKRAAGREPALSMPLEPSKLDLPPKSYGVEAFKVRMPKSAGQAIIKQNETSSAPVVIEPLPLPADLSEILPADAVWVEAIASGKNPPGKNYASRSELVFACLLWMLSRDVLPGHVLSIITAPELGISAHVLESGNSLRYARRQIERAMAVIASRNGGWPVVTDDNKPVHHHPRNIRFAFTLLDVTAHHNRFTSSDEFRGFGLEGRDLNDIGEILASAFFHEQGFVATAASIKRELIAMAHENQHHPVIDYLDGLVWDGTPRIDKWLADYCGADDTELNREFGSKLLIAGVRRIKQPGVKFDTMLVLEGAQGAGKSRLVQLLAVRDEWFCGSLDLKSDDKTKAELLKRAWIVECQELEGVNKTTSQTLKRFLSTSIDTYRRAYGRDAGEYRRHCIILGSTNEGNYLRDLTGNRRIWPVFVRRIDLVRFAADVDQLWAEAVMREATGESITLSEHLWDAAAQLQGQRMVEDAYADVLEDTFAAKKGRVSMDSVKLLLGLDTSRMLSTDTRRIKAVMEALGWEYGTHRLYDLGRQERTQRKGFVRGDLGERKVEYIARRHGGGAVIISPVEAKLEDEAPF